MWQRIIFIIGLIIPSCTCIPALAQEQLKLSIDTSGLIDLLDIQDKSLDELETAWNMMQAQLIALQNYNKELQLHIDESEEYRYKLEQTLETARSENAAALEYQKSLQERLAEANRLHRAATISGVISGITLGTGVSLMVAGGVNKNMPVVYTGLGLTGAAVFVWTLGKACNWW